MTTADKRREGQVAALRTVRFWSGIDGNWERMEALLIHLDETDPKVAYALRYGIPDSVPMEVIKHGLKRHDFELTPIDCGPNCCAGCEVDICRHCGQPAEGEFTTEFCLFIDYPEQG